MVYTGEDLYIYAGRTGTWKGGDPSSDKHIPLNPVTEISFKGILEGVEYEYCVNSLDPSLAVEKILEATEITLTTYYRDPFLMLMLFSHKTVTATWTGTGDSIDANFSEADHIDYIWIQIHLEDRSGSASHLNYLYDGGVITDYKLTGEPGKLIREEITIKFAEMASNTQAIDVDDGFDDATMNGTGRDGGWSLWDGTYTLAGKPAARTVDASITWNAVVIAGLSDYLRWTLHIQTPQAMVHACSSKTAAITYKEQRPAVECTLDVVPSANTNFTQLTTAFSSKTKSTFKIDVDNNEWQFTNAILDNLDPFLAAISGKAFDTTLTVKATPSSVLSYDWTGNEATDPSAFIQHDDP